MRAEIIINNSASDRARYVTWAPSPARIRLTDPTGVSGPSVEVRITSQTSPGGGRLLFRRTASAAGRSLLTLTLPRDGTSVPFFVTGRFGSPSRADGDVSIVASVGRDTLATLPVMVRIRKNAATLTPGERDRFVRALAQLNNQGTGRFADFRNMHVNAASPEAHGGAGFLPWHRAYLLDLERELQAIDPSVSLPYWRFDRPARELFNGDFMGVSDAIGTVSFSQTNPLQFWFTDGIQGVTRRPLFNTATAGADVITQQQTLALGSDYADFQAMEDNPHGSAHVSFGGFISSIGTAARDPLFFLLHANVDRLWAKWQRQYARFDPATPQSFDSNGGGNRVGHNLTDTMWPWNGITTTPRPSTAPGGTLANSPCVSAPGGAPRVEDMLDYRGTVSASSRMGFDYDDVRL